jgi:hypothetical protein
MFSTTKVEIPKNPDPWVTYQKKQVPVTELVYEIRIAGTEHELEIAQRFMEFMSSHPEDLVAPEAVITSINLKEVLHTGEPKK